MKKQNSDKKFTKLDDYLKCYFFKSNKIANNRFKSINAYKNKNLEMLIRKRKIKNKTQNIFDLIKIQNLLLNHYKKNFKLYYDKSKEIKSKDEIIKYIKYDDKILGKGAFGICYKFRAIDKNDMNFYAGKIIEKKEIVVNQKNSLKDEIYIQKEFKDNPKVVRVKDYFEDEDNVYIILELCKNKSLLDYLYKRGGRLTEIEVKCYIFQLLQGLKCLHKKGVIHRDLKPNNLLLDYKNELKIGDFGLVVKLKNNKERITDVCGTYNYMAPEIFENKGKGYSFEVDIWSVGIIMYQLLTGKLPFDGENRDEIKKNILGFQPEDLDVSGLSEVAANLIKQILVKDPKKRPGINQIIYHYFFHDTEFPKYITSEILNKIEKEKKEKDKNKEEVNEKLKMKLYNLIIDDIPEIEYENIKNYVIKEPVSAYKYYITYFHESIQNNYCYYEFNNEIIGIAFMNKENGSFDINMIYSKETKFFYHININKDNEEDDENDEIQRYSKEEIPEKLKKYADLILNYYDFLLKKRNNIEVKDENPTIKEQKSFSQSTEKSEQNSLSNENSIISQHKVEDKNNLIYVRKLITYKSVTILYLSDNTIETIFGDKKKILMSEINQKIEIIGQDNKISVVSTINALQNSNNDFTNRLKFIRKIIYKNITKKFSKDSKNQINDIK